MKKIVIYLAGIIVIVPAVLMLLTENVVLCAFVLPYAVFVYRMPKLLPKTKRFWRTWHRINFSLSHIGAD